MTNLVAKVPSMPYCLCHRKTVNSCMKEKREKRKLAYELDMNYLSDNLQKAIIICGIPQEKAFAAQEAIVRAFTHFDEIRYRVDRVPRKRLCKEDLIHDLGVQANMDRIEAQVTYSIVRRAFKAYFYGSSIHGRRMQDTVSGMRHRSECLWVHAAKRTAQVLAAYYGLMSSEQKQYEERLECVYKSLHDGLKANEIFDDDMICTCRPFEKESRLSEASQATGQLEILFAIHEVQNSKEFTITKGFKLHTSSETWRGRPSQLSCPGRNTDSDEEQKPEVEGEHEEANIHCQCKPLHCVNVFEPVPPRISTECSQGPFICRWVPMSEEDRVQPCMPEPQPEICPPCKDSDATPCDSECECICEFCECDEFDMAMEEEGENLKLSDEQIEDNDTDFTFVAPLRDPSSKTTTKAESKKDEVEEEAQPVDDSECKCVCKYKLGILDPEDINYVASLKDNPTESAEEEAKAETELGEPRKPILIVDLAPIEVPTDPITPPSGIQLHTAQCWLDPNYKMESSSISVLSESEPPLPPGLKPAGCRAMAEQKRLIEKLRAEQPPPVKRSANVVHVTLAMALSANSKQPKSAAPSPMPNTTIAAQHGSSKAAAPANRYKEGGVSPPPIAQTKQSTTKPQPPPIAQTKQSTIKPQPPAQRKSPPQPQRKPPTATAIPVPPAASTNTRQSNSEPPLTKDDILDIIGLK